MTSTLNAGGNRGIVNETPGIADSRGRYEQQIDLDEDPADVGAAKIWVSLRDSSGPLILPGKAWIVVQVNLSKQHPDLYEKVRALSRAADEAFRETGLDPKLAELVKIRVSQINGCAFCLRMHTRDAIDLGESADRLAVLAGWWESQYFDEQEQAALALAEEVTRLPVGGDRTWDDGSLSDEQVSAVSWLAVVMNSWNRIAIRSGYPVGP